MNTCSFLVIFSIIHIAYGMSVRYFGISLNYQSWWFLIILSIFVIDWVEWHRGFKLMQNVAPILMTNKLYWIWLHHNLIECDTCVKFKEIIHLLKKTIAVLTCRILEMSCIELHKTQKFEKYSFQNFILPKACNNNDKFYKIIIDIMPFMRNYNSWFYVDMITHPCPNLHSGLTILC